MVTLNFSHSANILWFVIILTPKKNGLIQRQQTRQNIPGFRPNISLTWFENFSEPVPTNQSINQATWWSALKEIAYRKANK